MIKNVGEHTIPKIPMMEVVGVTKVSRSTSGIVFRSLRNKLKTYNAHGDVPESVWKAFDEAGLPRIKLDEWSSFKAEKNWNPYKKRPVNRPKRVAPLEARPATFPLSSDEPVGRLDCCLCRLQLTSWPHARSKTRR